MVAVTSNLIQKCFIASLIWVTSATPVPSVDGLSIVEATIEELQNALSSGQINAVQLLAKHLHRVARYSRRGPYLNAIPVFNPTVFDDAQASDEYRSQNNGHIRSALEGIPFTVKDSYMLAGTPVAAGSPAFENLTASEDAFTVSQLRKSGAIAVGKTNMPPMANGGMQRGLYGRADSPYNVDYLTAAMGSGSSNGCGTSTAASMAVFGMAEETVSSGRSPASNNGLVAYTPSRGVLSIRGNWPLQPSADVVVPHTRTVKDMFAVLDILAVKDNDTRCDFWRGQPFVTLPEVEDVRPGSFLTLANAKSLKGKRIGVPRMFIGEDDPAAVPVYIRPSVRALWDGARITLESLGAKVEEVDFPAVTNYDLRPWDVEVETEWPIPRYYNYSGGPNGTVVAAYAWDDFLAMVDDTSSITKLTNVDPDLVFPQLPGTLPDRYNNRLGNRTGSYNAYINAVQNRSGEDIFKLPNVGAWLQSLEYRRIQDLENWMDQSSLDLLVWPSAGDVGPQDAETNETATERAWRNGVARSNGNAAIRQLGIPTVSVSMGAMSDIGMPVDLTFAGKAYDDSALLSYGYAFETAHEKRFAPPRTPELETDIIPPLCTNGALYVSGSEAPILIINATRVGGNALAISGAVTPHSGVQLEVYLDGVNVGPMQLNGSDWSIAANITTPWEGSDFPETNVPSQSLAMIVAVASAPNGRSAGKLLFA